MKALAVSALIMSSGCTVGDVGFLVGEITRADGAYVYSIEVLGAHLRPRSYEAGLAIGYQRRIYIFPDNLEDLPPTGRYYFSVPFPNCNPIALDSRVYGLDVRTTSQEAGLTIGARATTVMADIASDQSRHFELDYRADSPEATRLLQISGEHHC